MKGGYSRKSVLTGITSFLIVLFTMPLGHALMIFMEHVLSSTALHYAAFTMGAVGLVMVIIGVFAKGDTRQTLWGLFGGLLFWTGWVEFIYVYYAHRYEVEPLLNAAGEVVTKPEYLIMHAITNGPATFLITPLLISTSCLRQQYLHPGSYCPLKMISDPTACSTDFFTAIMPRPVFPDAPGIRITAGSPADRYRSISGSILAASASVI